jgi:hypothetical protein
VEERRKIRLKTRLANLMEFKKEAKKNKELLLEYTQMTFWQRLKFLFKGTNYAHRSS